MNAATIAHATVEVPAASEGWVDTGIDVTAGQTVTLVATGSAALVGGPDDLTFAPHLLLCHRITPDGQFDKLPAPTTTFVADVTGRLELIAHFPGAWTDRTGGLDPAWPRAAATGSYTVEVSVGADSAPRPRLPAGWAPLWRIGASDVYRDAGSAADGTWIECRSRRDAGLVARPVDVPLTDRTRLRWQWRVLGLPSRVAEDTLLTHDYISVAVEFDNGRDLTYLWSSTLPVGTTFACPLPWWDAHETHQVVRSGADDLGRWVDQDQPVLADYSRAIGGPPPERILAIWLIVVSVFQGGLAECDYRGIELGES